MKNNKTQILALVGLVMFACSENEPGNIRTTTANLTLRQSRVLGFEDPTNDWTTNNGSAISTSANKVQGLSALAVSLNGYSELASTTIDAPGSAKSVASFDLMIPQVLSWGDARLIVKIPSQGHYWRDLGGTNLDGLSAGTFHPLSFPIPQDVRGALDSSATDVSFVIVLNAQAGLGDFIIDDLVVSDEGNSGGGSATTTALTRFSLPLPDSSDSTDVLLSATDSLTVDDRSTIGAAGELAQIFSIGPSTSEFGAGVNIHANLFSEGDVEFLRSNAHFYGDITTSGSLLRQNNVVIDGDVETESGIASSELAWTVEWPISGGGDISLPPNSPSLDLAPGTYDSIQVFSSASLAVTTGVYFVNSLVVEPGAHIRVNTTGGPVQFYIKDTLRLRAGLDYVAGPRGQVFFGYLGNQAALFEEAIVATVAAPNSTIELRRPNSGLAHEGSFFGKAIHVFSDATVRHLPLDFTFTCINSCSNKGSCVETSLGFNECSCDVGWSGEDCSTPVDLEVSVRTVEDLFDPEIEGNAVITAFLRSAYSGGSTAPQDKTALLALNPEVVLARLQAGLDKSEYAVERSAILYVATVVDAPELLPLYERVIDHEVPLAWMNVDPHNHFIMSEHGVIARAVLGAFWLYAAGHGEARNVLVRAAGHSLLVVRGMVAHLVGRSSDTALQDEVRAILPQSEHDLMNTRSATPSDLYVEMENGNVSSDDDFDTQSVIIVK